MRPYFVYLISNKTRRLYCGICGDLTKRFREHLTGAYANAFTARYNFDRLVYFESAESLGAAARREKQIKAWSRAKKVALVESLNPEWHDLSARIGWERVLS